MAHQAAIKTALSSMIDTMEVWKANNFSWRQMVAMYRGRRTWLKVLRNFRELEGSWPGAFMKMAKVFQGRLIKGPDNP